MTGSGQGGPDPVTGSAFYIFKLFVFVGCLVVEMSIFTEIYKKPHAEAFCMRLFRLYCLWVVDILQLLMQRIGVSF